MILIAAYIVWFLILIGIDQWSKYLAFTTGRCLFDNTSFFSCEVVLNKGISWSMFDDLTTPWLIHVGIAAICIALAYYAMTRYKQGYLLWIEVAILAGAISNSIDRVVYGGVVDFIALHYGHWYFPIFNIADVVITVGVFCMIIQMIKE